MKLHYLLRFRSLQKIDDRSYIAKGLSKSRFCRYHPRISLTCPVSWINMKLSQNSVYMYQSSPDFNQVFALNLHGAFTKCKMKPGTLAPSGRHDCPSVATYYCRRSFICCCRPATLEQSTCRRPVCPVTHNISSETENSFILTITSRHCFAIVVLEVSFT